MGAIVVVDDGIGVGAPVVGTVPPTDARASGRRSELPELITKGRSQIPSRFASGVVSENPVPEGLPQKLPPVAGPPTIELPASCWPDQVLGPQLPPYRAFTGFEKRLFVMVLPLDRQR